MTTAGNMAAREKRTRGQVCVRDSFPLLHAFISLGIYPAALALVYFLDNILGWH